MDRENFIQLLKQMQETVWTLGAQISDEKEITQPESTTPEQEVKKDPKVELVADPSFYEEKAEPATTSETPQEEPEQEDENSKTLEDVLIDKAEHEETLKRQSELDEKVNAELGDVPKEDVKDEKELEKEVKEEIAKEEPLVEISEVKTDLPKEAIETLNRIKDIYEKETYKLRVDNKVLSAERDAYKEKIEELVKEKTNLEWLWASASARAMYFDKVMNSGNKEQVTDYLVDLLWIHYPSISKQQLSELAWRKKSFNSFVKADSEPTQVITKSSKLQQLQNSYNWVYKGKR